MNRTNRDDGVACRDGDDVGAGDHVAPAGGVDGALNAVDHVEAADGVGVRRGHLLAGEEGRVVQQDGPVTPLNQQSTKRRRDGEAEHDIGERTEVELCTHASAYVR